MGTRSPPTFFRSILLGFASSPALLHAQTEWLACPVPDPLETLVQRPENLPPRAVYIEADSALFSETGISSMSGDVQISQQDKKLRADQATYNQQNSEVRARGKVRFSTSSMQVNAQNITYNLQANAGEMQDAEYHLGIAEGRGSSTHIVQQQDATHMEKATYTTCPAGKNDWSLNASSIELQHKRERGIARNVTLKIRKTPILYLPYLSFPLTDTRKSGFLWPNIGTNAKSGLQISTPYYFNLAPNYDLTLTPTLLSRRGLQLGTEFRYLEQKHQGQFDLVLLPDDRVSTRDNRYYFNIQQDSQLSPLASLNVHAEGVSDDQYFVDLGNSLAATSIVNLERRAEYLIGQDDWSFSALAQNFQILDGSPKTYSRLPQLLLKYHPSRKGNGLNLDVETEYTRFSGNDTEVNGKRLDLMAQASKKFSTDAAYVKPSLTLRHTEYNLDDGKQTRISRSLPTASLDSGLFFERNVKQGKYVQTLEPRLFYTYTPYRDQSAIPVFDTTSPSLSYDQLFAENRFAGKDRIGDANRLSASLTTRIQDPQEGRELFRASIGQMYYFGERKVTLPDETPITGASSELVLEAAGEINPRTQLASTAYWDSKTGDFSAGEMRVRYKDDKKRVLNLGYDQRKDDFESASVSFEVPVKSGWKAVGSWEHDLQNHRRLESVIGAEYESCCWKTRVASRNYLLPDNQTRDNAVFVEVELKGLGNFGSGARNLLEDRIYGYE